MKDLALLEYDPSPHAVIDPDHEKLGVRLPPVAVFAFVGEAVDEYAREHHAEVVAEFVSITKTYPVYRIEVNGRALCLCQAPCGAAPATQLLDWLIGYGVRAVLSTGSCGVLTDLPENAFLIPTRALRDEGTSFHYLPPARFVELEEATVRRLREAFDRRGIPYQPCTTWTTDGFYRETKEKVVARRAEGCAAVEMECAALAACAQFRGVRFGQFLFTADSLHALDAHDMRDWGSASLRPALRLAVDIAATDLYPCASHFLSEEAPMLHFNFSRNAWDPAALPATYSVACRDCVAVTQEDDCISADFNPAIGDFDYIGLAMREPVEGDRTVTVRCAFEALGAPLVVLADSVTTDEFGHRRFGPMYEVVAYAGGCNVWRILPNLDPNDPERGYTVRSITQQSFPVPEKTPLTMTVRISGTGTDRRALTVTLGDRTFTVDAPDLPDRYTVGLTLCEGKNRFYSLDVE